jgi:hypothetical protein
MKKKILLIGLALMTIVAVLCLRQAHLPSAVRASPGNGEAASVLPYPISYPVEFLPSILNQRILLPGTPTPTRTPTPTPTPTRTPTPTHDGRIAL